MHRFQSVFPSCAVFCFALIVLAACGGGNSDNDAGLSDGAQDAGDAGPATTIEDLPIDEEIALVGLGAAVDVVVDDRGIPHIYAENPEDAIRIQGYLMAKDRMGQMEFLRRAIQGRLAEVAGSLDPSLVEMDIGARFIGFHRQAQAIFDSLASDDPTRILMEAYSHGVTDYIQAIRDGHERLPGILPSLLNTPLLTDWSPVDVLSLARYESRLLSDTAAEELDLTAAAMAIAQSFPTDDPDPRLAARAGLLSDLWSFAPATRAITCPECQSKGRRAPSPAPAPQAVSRPEIGQVKAAREFLRGLDRLNALVGLEDRGSNNWVVSGAHTESGAAIMANDPHLSLPSPPVWWLNHINTARAGGDWDVMGVSFAGTPAVTLGFNRHLAWGATVTNYDVTDIYHEIITPGDGGPDTVQFLDEQIPIETITESIELNMGEPVEISIEVVPHHGPIFANSRTSSSALSFRWTGHEVSNELATFVGLCLAKNAAEAQAAVETFECGSQNLVVATRDGDILWNTHSYVPTRPSEALSYDPVSGSGFSPAMVLPGTGEFEWSGRIPAEEIPQLLNPARGWIGSANQDGVGTSLDGNPFNDPLYLGWSFDLGHRMARMNERMEDLLARGDITPDDMIDMQADHRSPLGALLAGGLVAAVGRAQEEAGAPGSHPDLSQIVTECDAAALQSLDEMATRLNDWSFQTPAAVEGSPSTNEIADSVAATIFNVTLTRLVPLAFGDELQRIGERPSSQQAAKALQWAMLEPERLTTFDSDLGDTVLWDDLDTVEIESRDERILRAMLAASDFLKTRLGPDMNSWRWGKLHTIRFKTLVPVDMVGASFDTFSIPPLNDPDYPDGFPRHGDLFVLDACNFNLFGGEDFSYGSGPSQRLIVELSPDGPKAYNALPGGQQHAGDAPHHADEAEFWRRNQAPRLAYEESEVVAAAERRIRFLPE